MTTTHPHEGQPGLPFLLRTARRTYARGVVEALAEAGFDDVPRNGAFVLSGIGNGAAAVQLLPGLGVSKQAASKLVDTLVLRGYLARGEDLEDRRRLTLTLTDRGEAAAAAVRAGADAVDRRLADRLGAADRRTLRRALYVLGSLDDEGAADAGPARMNAFCPVFPVRDLEAALAHYAALGFTTRPYTDGGYGFADRDEVSLHLALLPDHRPDANVCAAYLHVDDADALAARWSAPGIGGRTVAPADTGYGLREGAHTDPDGNLIRFGSPIPDGD